MIPERYRRLKEVLARRQPDLTVLMESVSKSHNFSAILRSCDAVGVLEAHLVASDPSVGLHHGTSAGTKKWVRNCSLGRWGAIQSALTATPHTSTNTTSPATAPRFSQK